MLPNENILKVHVVIVNNRIRLVINATNLKKFPCCEPIGIYLGWPDMPDQRLSLGKL